MFEFQPPASSLLLRADVLIASRSSRVVMLPMTRDRTGGRRISAVRAILTLYHEEVAQDDALSARADFQPVTRGLTP